MIRILGKISIISFLLLLIPMTSFSSGLKFTCMEKEKYVLTPNNGLTDYTDKISHFTYIIDLEKMSIGKYKTRIYNEYKKSEHFESTNINKGMVLVPTENFEELTKTEFGGQLHINMTYEDNTMGNIILYRYDRVRYRFIINDFFGLNYFMSTGDCYKE